MENNELIKILQLLAKTDSEKQELDDELLNKAVEKVLSDHKLKIAVGKNGQLMIALSREKVLPSLEMLGIEKKELKSYLDAVMKRILDSLVEMIFNEKEPEGELEEKIFKKFNVPYLRVKAKLKEIYTSPVVDVVEVHPAEISIDGEELQYYLIKIEHLKDKKPVTLNFILTKADLVNLYKAIEEVLSDGDVTQGN
ncbi:hypothetical protein [Thermococcus sp.]